TSSASAFGGGVGVGSAIRGRSFAGRKMVRRSGVGLGVSLGLTRPDWASADRPAEAIRNRSKRNRAGTLSPVRNIYVHWLNARVEKLLNRVAQQHHEGEYGKNNSAWRKHCIQRRNNNTESPVTVQLNKARG